MQILAPKTKVQKKGILTRQHRQQEDVVGEGNQPVRSELVENAVVVQVQIQPGRNAL